MELSTVVVAPTRHVLAVLPGAPLGSAAESRLGALRSPADRDDFTAARLLAAHLLGVAPADLRQRCEVCGGEHGLPLPVGGLHVSWSHAHGWVAAGVSRARLGVDVEAERGVILAEALTPGEAALVSSAPDPARAFRLAWTAKEACVKAGAAHLDGVAELDVLAAPGTLRPSHGGLHLSAWQHPGATAAAATTEPAHWAILGDSGELVPVPGRAVGSPA
ncbi:4'-phosphopantetheinyl transferase family protein [Leifsonia shinshuensis]|uniref:4'-phosphopantetheinyl transferase superfamily protein n=1 Tax=Leifsonia shinshuensis TaxID=150026 RepID=A0A7G6Y5D2_9MICO|nr:4'-phosphopantetheinyl transferase superfamily protein [Leifsonia shinshuensis]QNE33697.1 4'-phosphopantetheinyl transferase superfamily protein [Leifsonia shinshuensis]